MIRLNPSEEEHRYSLIWLHGRAESADTYKDLFLDDRLAIVPKSCRVILPTAPVRPVTCNRGRLLTSWYDIITLNRPPTMPLEEILPLHSQTDIRESAQTLTELIDQEADAIGSSDKVFIGGFSQGGTAAIFTFLLY